MSTCCIQYVFVIEYEGGVTPGRGWGVEPRKQREPVDMQEKWWSNGAEASSRWGGAERLWEMAREERERGEDCWGGTLLNSLLLGSYAIELVLKCWSKLAHASAATGVEKPHPFEHDLGKLWKRFPKGPYRKFLEERWKGWRDRMKPEDRIGSIQKVFDDIGPVFTRTRYLGDAKNMNEEEKQKELLAKIIARPDRYWRCFEACSRVFITGFVLYGVAQLERQGERDEAKALSDCLKRDGWTPEGVEEGVREMSHRLLNLD